MVSIFTAYSLLLLDPSNDGAATSCRRSLFAVERTTVGSGHFGQDLLHLGARESSHCLRANVTQQISSQQHAGGRLVVRGLEDANLVILTERPIHLLDAHPHRLHLGGPVGYPLGRLLGGLDTLVGKLNQTNVRRHNVTPLGKSVSVERIWMEFKDC